MSLGLAYFLGVLTTPVLSLVVLGWLWWRDITRVRKPTPRRYPNGWMR